MFTILAWDAENLIWEIRIVNIAPCYALTQLIFPKKHGGK
jgi:hypothetical protein